MLHKKDLICARDLAAFWERGLQMQPRRGARSATCLSRGWLRIYANSFDSSTSFGDSGGLRTRDALLTDTSSGARNCHALYTPFFHVPYLAQNSSDLLVNRYIEC